MEIRPVKGQIDDLLAEIRDRANRNERVLVTTLTKRMSEDLAGYYTEVGVRCRYMHSEIETLERVKLLAGLRKGEFDVLIGINLLREGLDLPEVSLVAILDADKEGFLRSAGSLIQTMGRAARHVEGRAILYADKMTDSMRRAIDETNRRRDDPDAPTTRSTASRRNRSSAPSTWGWRRSSRPNTATSWKKKQPACPNSPPRPTSISTSPSSKPRCARRPRSSNSKKPPGCATPSRNCASKEFLFT